MRGRVSLVEREIICIDKAGHEKRITVFIGIPYKNGNAWACPIEIKNLYKKLLDVVGVDSFQSLMLAIELIRSLLEDYVYQGGKLLSTERKEITVKELFEGG